MYTDDWMKAKIPVVPITDKRVNMFQENGIELFAIAGCALPRGSFKTPAVAGLVNAALACGALQQGDIVVEASSGRTGNELVHMTRGGVSEVWLVMKLDVPATKRGLPMIGGARIITPEPGLTPIETARKIGGGWDREHKMWKKNGKFLNLDQYGSPHVSDLYETWAVPKILDEIETFDILVTGIGTAGTLVGLSNGFRKRLGDSVTIVGVLCKDGHEIPGMRDLAGMKDIFQPWEEACDYRVTVERDTAFLCAPWLDWTANLPAGPTGGATYAAACRIAKKMIQEGTLDPSGKTRIAFVVHDDITPYVADRFLTEFPMENFNPTTAKLPKELIFGR